VADWIIAGLGNPGSEHAHQRHNVGFWCMNHLAKRLGSSWSTSRTAATAHGRVADADVLIVKPRTYVNRSGNAIGPLLRRENLDPTKLIVVYDELDLPEGNIRLRPKGTAGGHNGLKSIIEATGSGDFGRIRVGIGRPWVNGLPSRDPEVIMGYVLSAPPKAARETLDTAVERACSAVEAVIREGWDAAMNVFNRNEATSNE